MKYLLSLAFLATTFTSLEAGAASPNSMNATSGNVTCFDAPVSYNNLRGHINNLYVFTFLNEATLKSFGMFNHYANVILKLENVEAGIIPMATFVRQNAGQEVCKPGYDCTDDNGLPKEVWGHNSCDACAAVETVPPTNPPTCLTSCALCCSHFSTPPRQNCLTKCEARNTNDRC
jgi:hypothetical protein